MYNIDFYENAQGQSDILNFLNGLEHSNQKSDRILLKKIMHQLDLLEALGNALKEPQSKYLKGYRYPLLELRPMPERIFYASWKQNHFVLLHHYSKRQNKTSRREIEKALNNLED